MLAGQSVARLQELEKQVRDAEVLLSSVSDADDERHIDAGEEPPSSYLSQALRELVLERDILKFSLSPQKLRSEHLGMLDKLWIDMGICSKYVNLDTESINMQILQDRLPMLSAIFNSYKASARESDHSAIVLEMLQLALSLHNHRLTADGSNPLNSYSIHPEVQTEGCKHLLGLATRADYQLPPVPGHSLSSRGISVEVKAELAPTDIRTGRIQMYCGTAHLLQDASHAFGILTDGIHWHFYQASQRQSAATEMYSFGSADMADCSANAILRVVQHLFIAMDGTALNSNSFRTDSDEE